MKKFLLILLPVFITITVNAQKNFQGEITYNLHDSKSEKQDAALKIMFGVNKLKLRFKEKEDYDKEELMVLLDSAAIFMVNRETKTFTKKMLQVVSPAKQLQKRAFAGHASTPVTQESNAFGKMMSGLMGTSDVVFYLADSLYYTIPAAFAGNQELIAIQKNKIVLGAEIKLNMGYSGITDTLQNNIITVEAVEIKPMAINDDEFAIPADYVNRESIVYAPVEDTITLSNVDTVRSIPPAKKPAAKKPVKPAKPKTAVKSSAVKRKE